MGYVSSDDAWAAELTSNDVLRDLYRTTLLLHGETTAKMLELAFRTGLIVATEGNNEDRNT